LPIVVTAIPDPKSIDYAAAGFHSKDRHRGSNASRNSACFSRHELDRAWSRNRRLENSALLQFSHGRILHHPRKWLFSQPVHARADGRR
jgi:hypothetical protein